MVEAPDSDGPFRLRRVSLWMIVAGWLTFLASTMIGLYLNRHGQLAGYHELLGLLRGHATDKPFGSVRMQTFAKCMELSGAALFIGGMISVSLFDKADRIFPRRAN